MKTRLQQIATAVGLGTLAACGTAGEMEEPPASAEAKAVQPTPESELVGQGEAMAESLCAGCHAVGLSGESPHPDAIPFRRLASLYPVETLAEPLAEGIVVGHPDMPEWAFEPEQIDALLAYLQTVQVPAEADETAPIVDLAGEGQALAESLCAGCHAIGLEGESPNSEAMPFRQVSWSYPVEALAQPLAEGTLVAHPRMPQWDFEPQQIDALLAYMETVQVPEEG